MFAYIEQLIMTRYKTSVEIVETVFVVFVGNKIRLFKMDEKVLS